MPARRELTLLVRLALPIIVAQLAQISMVVADTLMAGRVSATDLAGVALGASIYWPVMLFLSGILQSVTPSVSQLNGAGRVDAVAHVTRQALWIAALSGTIMLGLMQFAGPFYGFMAVDARAIPVATGYLSAVVWGLPPMLGYYALRHLCEGMSWTLPGMVIALAALALKLPLNYWFIYGGLGLEPMGGVGCGVATAVVLWFELIAMILVVQFSRMRRIGVFSRMAAPDRREIGRLVRLGLPIGAARFFEMAAFSVMALLIGRLGVEALAAHQIATTINGVTFMIPLALGVAATIRVGHYVGAGDPDGARRAAWIAIAASLGFAAIAASGLLLFRNGIAALFSTDLQVVSLAAQLMVFIAVYQFFDDAQATATGALHGYKDTRTPMLVMAVSYWVIALPLGAVLAFGWGGQGLGVLGFWWGATFGLALVAAVLCARLRWLSRRAERIALYSLR
ncbi:MAG: MATE family efflux transporter [Pseudomonadales bacterium]